MKNKQPHKCPKCNSDQIIPVVYGSPTEKAMKEAKQGKLWLAGCVISGEITDWHCKECGKEW